VTLGGPGGRTFVTPAPVSASKTASETASVSSSETVTRPRVRPTPQPIFHVTMKTVMEHVSQLPQIRRVSQLPQIRHVSPLPQIKHVSPSPHGGHAPRRPIFGTLKPFVNLGSGSRLRGSHSDRLLRRHLTPRRTHRQTQLPRPRHSDPEQKKIRDHQLRTKNQKLY